jgi:glycerol-3-phosphate cytidylyltransferase-like family protein
VDTRNKIISLPDAPPDAVLLVGHFDVPGVEHARALRRIGERGRPIVAAVLPPRDGPGGEVLGESARAQMAAALRMVDYVLIAARPGQPGDLEDLVKRLKPADIIPLDEVESRRIDRLIRQIHHGQTL